MLHIYIYKNGLIDICTKINTHMKEKKENGEGWKTSKLIELLLQNKMLILKQMVPFLDATGARV